jgi:hypothetical protein
MTLFESKKQKKQNPHAPFLSLSAQSLPDKLLTKAKSTALLGSWQPIVYRDLSPSKKIALLVVSLKISVIQDQQWL